ncbi:GTP cyclohydrolase I FolE [Deinococcus yavapaiensis]|nr:GTP cyclohydrolase I FolE [Deinococcus yavapaiensis]
MRDSDTLPDEHIKTSGLADLTDEWLTIIGEDPDREGLLKTPKRVEKAWQFITSGYRMDLQEVANDAVFAAEGSEMVIVKDIEFYSMCEHHMLPFFGRAHIGYIPNGKILGLSKFARITDMFARRLQVQERVTTQIAEAIQELLQPLGTAVVLEGVHLCMAMRGVEKQHSSTTTLAMRGAFKDDARTRAEFMTAIRQRSVTL